MVDIPVQAYVKCDNKTCVFRGDVEDCAPCFEAKCENADVPIGPVDHRGQNYGPIAFALIGPEGGRFLSQDHALRELSQPRYLEAQKALRRSGQSIAVDLMKNYLL